MPKYSKSNRATLDNELYYDIFEKKGVKSLIIRRTKDFKSLIGLEIELLEERVWRNQDSLYKLSIEYYGQYNYWWVIALVNNKPTDSHYSVGDRIFIPRNPQHITGVL